MMYEAYLSGLIFLVSFQVLSVISPGPTMALIIRNSVYDRFKGIQTALGASLSSFFVKACAILGMVVIIQETPLFFSFIKIAGGGYLLVFGALSFKKSFSEFKHFKSPASNFLKKHPQQLKGINSPLLSGFLLNTVNPLNGIQFLIIYSTVINSVMPILLQLSYVIILSLISLLMLAVLAFFFSTARVQDRLEKWSFLLNFFTGCIMIYWGIKVLCVTL